MKIHIGKLIEGKPKPYLTGFFFGGMLFLFMWNRSLLIPFNNDIILLLSLIGIDAIGD